MGRDFDSVIEVSDRAVRANLIMRAKTRAPFFVDHKHSPSASCYTAIHVIDNSN
jgi:hypothetical protein